MFKTLSGRLRELLRKKRRKVQLGKSAKVAAAAYRTIAYNSFSLQGLYHTGSNGAS